MENIDILDENGNQLGLVKTREEVHSKGFWHKVVHIWIINSEGKLLLQKRSAEKKTNPNMWTTSVSGHLSAGDNSIDGAVREIDEEIGLKTNKDELKYLFTVSEEKIKSEIINRELIDVYLLRKDVNIKDLKLQEEEVSDIKWVTLSEFEQMVYTNNENLVEHKEMHKKLIEILK